MEAWRKELYHHGIKGQKWGVRRFQNKDGSYTPEGKQRYAQLKSEGARVVTKGTTFQRISTVKEKKTRGDRTYLSYKDADNDWYTEHMTDFRGGFNKVFKVNYKAAYDIYYPTHKKQVDEFISLYNDRPVKTLSEISRELGRRTAIASMQNPALSTVGKSYIEKYASNIFKNKIEAFMNNKQYEEAYQNFMAAYSEIPVTSLEYQKRLQKQGYNAIVDDNDTQYNTMFKGKPTDSLIVFNPKENLTITSSTKLTEKEYNEAKHRNKKRFG